MSAVIPMKGVVPSNNTTSCNSSPMALNYSDARKARTNMSTM